MSMEKLLTKDVATYVPYKNRARESRKEKPQISPLRSPGFPVKVGGVVEHHAPFLKRKAHTRPCPVQRGRKSGYAPVEMTILFGNAKHNFQALSSRAEPRDLRFRRPFLETHNFKLKQNCHLDRSVAQWRDLRFSFPVSHAAQ
jgi:hypothetical protein